MWPEVLQTWAWQVESLLSASELPEVSWASLCRQESPSSRDPACRRLRENLVERSCISDCALASREARMKVRKHIQTRATSLCFAGLLRAKAGTNSFGCYLELAVYSELIGSSHLVIWDGEGVNFALGIFSSPQATYHQSREKCSLLIWALIFKNVPESLHNIYKLHLLAFPEISSSFTPDARGSYSKEQLLTNPIKIRLIVRCLAKPPSPHSILSISALLYKVTTLSPNPLRLFVCLWPSTEASDSVIETLRAKETYCFYCQRCMTRLLEDRWGADGRGRASVEMGFYLRPPPQEEERVFIDVVTQL